MPAFLAFNNCILSIIKRSNTCDKISDSGGALVLLACNLAITSKALSSSSLLMTTSSFTEATTSSKRISSAATDEETRTKKNIKNIFFKSNVTFVIIN